MATVIRRGRKATASVPTTTPVVEDIKADIIVEEQNIIEEPQQVVQEVITTSEQTSSSDNLPTDVVNTTIKTKRQYKSRKTKTVSVSDNVIVAIQSILNNLKLIHNMNNNLDITKIDISLITNDIEKSEIENYNQTLYNVNEIISKYFENVKSQPDKKTKKNRKQSDEEKEKNKAEGKGIHAKKEVKPELLQFMNLPSDTLVSRNEAIVAIYNYRKELQADPESGINSPTDKSTINIVGKLKMLFPDKQSITPRDVISLVSTLFVKN